MFDKSKMPPGLSKTPPGLLKEVSGKGKANEMKEAALKRRLEKVSSKTKE